MTDKEQSIEEMIAETMAGVQAADRALEASHKEGDRLAEESRREQANIGKKPKPTTPSGYKPPAPKETLNVQELLALRRMEAERALRRAGEAKKPQQPPRERPRAQTAAPGIPGLDKELAAVSALLKRGAEIDESQQRLLDEMAADPLEQQCDAVYAEVGRGLYALEQEEIEAAADAASFLDEDAREDEAEEQRERSGQPPPLRQVK